MTEQPCRAWRVHRAGRPADALRLEPATPVPPGPGEARVRVGAVGVNFPDLLVCAGRYQERPPFPLSPGFEAAGTVVEAGDGAGVDPGQRVVVVPELPNGAYQESLTVPAGQLYPVPDDLPVEQAAALHIAYQTAHVALHRRGGLRTGETLAVTGAAGGVGSAAVQLGRAAGARVIALVTGEAKAAACRAWGADEVVDLAGGADPADAVRALTGRRGADVVLDVVGGALWDRLRRAVAFEGRLLVTGFTGGLSTAPTNHVLLRNYAVVGVHLAPYRRHDPGLLRAVHDELVAGWRAGTVAPALHRVLEFENALQALELVERREVIGRVVLRAAG